MQFAVFVLRVSALAFLGIGLAFLVAPSAMGARVGVSLAGAIADNDVRHVDFRFTDPRGKWQHTTQYHTTVDEDLLSDLGAVILSRHRITLPSGEESTG